MTATTYINTHASTISDSETIDSGVLAGPVTVSGTVTVTGTFGSYIMSKIEVDLVAPSSGTSLTIGESGDTVSVGSGASFALVNN